MNTWLIKDFFHDDFLGYKGMFDMFLSKNDIIGCMEKLWANVTKMLKIKAFAENDRQSRRNYFQILDGQMYADVLYCWRMVFGKKLYRNYFIFYDNSGSY